MSCHLGIHYWNNALFQYRIESFNSLVFVIIGAGSYKKVQTGNIQLRFSSD